MCVCVIPMISHMQMFSCSEDTLLTVFPRHPHFHLLFLLFTVMFIGLLCFVDMTVKVIVG